MKCTELAQQIEQIQPNASPQDVARLCLLLTNEVDNLEALHERAVLQDAWKQMGLQLQLATDQHAAMTQELEDLAASDPDNFTQDQIWILIRAIKVQSQVLQMYVGHPLAWTCSGRGVEESGVGSQAKSRFPLNPAPDLPRLLTLT